jgi:hypothetical protein
VSGRDRADELLDAFNASTEGWERTFVDARSVRCTGCGASYDSAEGLTVVALAVSGDPRRIYLDRAACARRLRFEAVALMMEESDANSLLPLTCDSAGRTLPAWRIAEVRDGAVWVAGQEPWRDPDEAAPLVDFFAVDPVKNAAGTLEEVGVAEVGAADEGELRAFLDEADESK